jgi:hypothetical protein
MSQPYGPFVVDGNHECDNCKKVHPAKKLKAIPDLFERVEPGCPLPSGECPDCGALCYPIKRKVSPKHRVIAKVQVTPIGGATLEHRAINQSFVDLEKSRKNRF